MTALVVAQTIAPAYRIQITVGTSKPSSGRVIDMVSEIPVATTSHQAIPKLAISVM